MLTVQVVLLEFQKFLVKKSILDMESYRDKFERVFILGCLETSHIVEQCFFISQVIILVHMIMSFTKLHLNGPYGMFGLLELVIHLFYRNVLF